MRRTRIKPLGKKGKRNRAELAAIMPLLQSASQGRCVHCGGLPDWRGLHPHHLLYLSQGGATTLTNVQLWCAPCHFGLDGHKTEKRSVQP